MSCIEIYVNCSNKYVALRLPSGSRCGDIFERIGESRKDFYLSRNGLVKDLEDELCSGETIEIHGRLRGGKGGFGSMLRAIGAQIEKTTNREACRDLSGRRLRAINDEKRIRHYARIKLEKEREREEKRRKKLESIANAKPRHEFKDDAYFKDREAIPLQVEEAVEEAFAEKEEPTSSTSKRSGESSEQPSPKKFKGWMGDLEDFEDSDDQSDEQDDESKKTENDDSNSEEQSSNDNTDKEKHDCDDNHKKEEGDDTTDEQKESSLEIV